MSGLERVRSAVASAVRELCGLGPWPPSPELCAGVAARVVEMLATPAETRKRMVSDPCQACGAAAGELCCGPQECQIEAAEESVLRAKIIKLRDEWSKHADREWHGEAFVSDLDELLAGDTK